MKRAARQDKGMSLTHSDNPQSNAADLSGDQPRTPQPWFRGVPRYAWIVLALAALGWLFDTMDQNIFTLVRQPAVTSLLFPGIAARALTTAQQATAVTYGGWMTSIFLIGWAVGGLLFGSLGDRLGRSRTMMITILVYALFTGLSGLAHTIPMFGLFRFLTALGVGGEWAAGAAIVAETFPARSRGRALGLLQALSAFGNMMAAIVTLTIPVLVGHFSLTGENWRWAFAVGALLRPVGALDTALRKRTR